MTYLLVAQNAYTSIYIKLKVGVGGKGGDGEEEEFRTQQFDRSTLEG